MRNLVLLDDAIGSIALECGIQTSEEDVEQLVVATCIDSASSMFFVITRDLDLIAYDLLKSRVLLR